MNIVTRDVFNAATSLLDAVSGTENITRCVELECFRWTPPLPSQSFSYAQETQQNDQFMVDVWDIVACLDDDGCYRGTSRPADIAALFMQSGHPWATKAKIRKAQSIKRR